ncbi:MAG: DEAD/DEAH box helicase [bacterium]
MKNGKGQITLDFHQGTLLLKNDAAARALDFFRWDERSQQWRAKALYYQETVRWLDNHNIEYDDSCAQYKKLRLKLNMRMSLRSYQKEALQAWRSSGYRGSVCLPTGAGKTWVALQAMSEVKISTLVVLPTLDLMNQWYDAISDAFGVEVGLLGGGYHEIRNITVTTYESAYRHIDKYGHRFGFLIFDEVHHLPAATYSHIPEMSIAFHRLGLTATYQRLDGLHGKLERLIGPVVFEKSIKDLEGEHLAEYETMKITVNLSPEEKRLYHQNQQIYEDYIRDHEIKFYGADLEPFLRKSAFDPQARKAFLARLECRRIIIGVSRKIEILETLLKRHHADRVLIFSESNDLVYKISEAFLIPALTHHTKTIERKEILDNFRNGIYSALVTSKVLNEGVDVPNANVAVILSGSASPTEHVQRLGRILRKEPNKQAILYELVTRGTKESQISYRRRRSDAYQ